MKNTFMKTAFSCFVILSAVLGNVAFAQELNDDYSEEYSDDEGSEYDNEPTMEGFYLGAEYSYRELTAEGLIGYDSYSAEYESAPINLLAGYTSNDGDMYVGYTITNLEAEDYDGITELILGARVHESLAVGKTGLNIKGEILLGNFESGDSYFGAVAGVGGTSRIKEAIVLNYGVDFYVINYDFPDTEGYTRQDIGLGLYINMHFLFLK